MMAIARTRPSPAARISQRFMRAGYRRTARNSSARSCVFGRIPCGFLRDLSLLSWAKDRSGKDTNGVARSSGDLAIGFVDIGTIADQPTDLGELASRIYCGDG